MRHRQLLPSLRLVQKPAPCLIKMAQTIRMLQALMTFRERSPVGETKYKVSKHWNWILIETWHWFTLHIRQITVWISTGRLSTIAKRCGSGLQRSMGIAIANCLILIHETRINGTRLTLLSTLRGLCFPIRRVARGALYPLLDTFLASTHARTSSAEFSK